MNEYAPVRKTYLDSSQWPLFPGIQRSALVLLKDPVDDDFQVAIVHMRLRRHRHRPPVPAASPEDACSQLPACIGLPGMTPSDVYVWRGRRFYDPLTVVLDFLYKNMV